ncbi:MAG: C40 family peptidase [Bacteroidales bacterium]|nr:C40 family peptidase [Bacteroidales bacterium]
MFIKLLSVTFISLFANCIQPQPETQLAELDREPIIASEINRSELVAFAKSYLGTTYQYASADPMKGFDCSGFVYFVFKHFNIDMPRSSKEYTSLQPKLKPEEFKAGDVLVFYGFNDNTQIGHVGIICEADGMNSKFIHSSSGIVKGIIISNLGSELYTRRFYKCVDVISL